MTPQEVLALPMQPNDAGAETIQGYLLTLLRDVWEYGEGFSGKRPFGNSGWEWDLYTPLVVAGAVPGTVDADGFPEDVDKGAAHLAIRDAIQALGATS